MRAAHKTPELHEIYKVQEVTETQEVQKVPDNYSIHKAPGPGYISNKSLWGKGI